MPNQNNLTIKYVNENVKVSKFFNKEFKNCKYSLLRKLLRQKDIKVNGVRISEDIDLFCGDKVEIFCKKEDLFFKYTNLEIVYEDDNILVINKPDSLEVEGEGSATEILNKKLNKKVEPVNRIDRNTIGLVIFSKNLKTKNELIKATKNNLIEKYYLAWVYGLVCEGEKIEKAYLFKDSKKAISLISKTKKPHYVEIQTEYNLVKTKDNKSLINVKIHSGKTHQIRAHLAFLGYPLIGDGKYSNNKINSLFNEKHHQLFAYKIKFNLPKESFLNYLNKCKIEIKNSKFA